MMLELLTAFLGTMGFALLCGVRRKYLLIVSFGGLLCWGSYLLFDFWGADLFFSSLFSAATVALFSEISARVLKAPATLFFTPAIVPLIPGRTLYYAMSCIVKSDRQTAAYYASVTAQCALGIAAGISIVLTLFLVIERLHKIKRT